MIATEFFNAIGFPTLPKYRIARVDELDQPGDRPGLGVSDVDKERRVRRAI